MGIGGRRRKVKAVDHKRRATTGKMGGWFKRNAIDYLIIIVGTAMTATAVNAFYVPNQISDGGVSGLGIILLYLLHVPVWLTLIALNLPLLWLSHRLWGGRVSTRTVFGTVMLSLWVALLHWHPFTRNILLATVYGGVLSGVGLGLVFRSKGTTGGTDVVARFLTHVLPVSMGQGLLFMDVFVIAGFGVAFNPTHAMYSLIALFISSRAIDLVQEGIEYARAFTIITQHGDELSHRILQEMGRGVTHTRGEGAYTGEPRDILFVVVGRAEVTRMKSLIYGIDPDAFVVVGNVHEVVGEGFRKPPVEE
ncbi:MAG: YitT family protein [Firmicutes bacterium]|nr:YitT family protein [Bacillota bacterium]MCL5064721.1 YitT family protein [Bacillota bacterium]